MLPTFPFDVTLLIGTGQAVVRGRVKIINDEMLAEVISAAPQMVVDASQWLEKTSERELKAHILHLNQMINLSLKEVEENTSTQKLCSSADRILFNYRYSEQEWRLEGALVIPWHPHGGRILLLLREL